MGRSGVSAGHFCSCGLGRAPCPLCPPLWAGAAVSARRDRFPGACRRLSGGRCPGPPGVPSLRVDTGTTLRGAARAGAGRAPWALGQGWRGGRPQTCSPSFAPGWSAEDRCPRFVAMACGLGAEPGGPFSAWCLGSLAGSLAQGRGKRPWEWLCIFEVAPPLSCLSQVGGGEGGWEPEPVAGLSLVWLGGRTGRQDGSGPSRHCWVWGAGHDVAAGVEISAYGFPNILPARHRTGCRDPGCPGQAVGLRLGVPGFPFAPRPPLLPRVLAEGVTLALGDVTLSPRNPRDRSCEGGRASLVQRSGVEPRPWRL